MTCQTAVIFGGARWGRTVTFDLESLVGVARESFLCFLLSFDLLTHFIFIKLAVVGTKFCLCSKVTDQLTDSLYKILFFFFLIYLVNSNSCGKLHSKVSDALKVGEKGESDRFSAFLVA